MIRAFLIAATLALPGTAASATDKMHDPIIAGALVLTAAHSLETPPTARSAAGYVTIENTGEVDDLLLSAAAPGAGTVQLHLSQTDASGVARMVHQDAGIPIPAGETVTLAPGGLHIMFMGIEDGFGTDEMIEVTLSFEVAGEVVLTFPIVAREDAPQAHNH